MQMKFRIVSGNQTKWPLCYSVLCVAVCSFSSIWYPVWHNIFILSYYFPMLCSSMKYYILYVISKWKKNTKGDPWVQRIGQRGRYTTQQTEWEQTTYCTLWKLIKHWCRRLSQPNSSPLLTPLFHPGFLSASQSLHILLTHSPFSSES